MHPVLIRLGPLPIHTFGVMLATGIVVGFTLLVRETRRLADPRITEATVEKLAWYMVLGVVLGGRLMHVIVELFRGNPYYRNNPLRIFAVWEGGLVMYGGLLTVMAVVLIFARRNQIKMLRLLDLVAPSLFLGDAIGRWGCLMAGDDYGKPTSWPIGITFTNPESLVPRQYLGVPLHPTQLYMSAKALIIALTLLWVTRRKKFDGQVAGIALMMYAVLRSIVEFARGDLDRGHVGPMSTAQFTSIFVFTLGVIILIKAPRRLLADDLAEGYGPLPGGGDGKDSSSGGGGGGGKRAKGKKKRKKK